MTALNQVQSKYKTINIIRVLLKEFLVHQPPIVIFYDTLPIDAI